MNKDTKDLSHIIIKVDVKASSRAKTLGFVYETKLDNPVLLLYFLGE